MSEFQSQEFEEFALDELALGGRLQMSIACEVLSATRMNPDLETTLGSILANVSTSPSSPHQVYPGFYMKGEGVAVMKSDLSLAAMIVERNPRHREDFRIAASGLLQVMGPVDKPR